VLAVDTNVVVRYLTGDDPAQARRARAIIDHEDVLVTATVLLESEWVLCTVYGFEPARLALSFENFAGLPHVSFAQADTVKRALAWFRSGMDFANALHLAGADGCDAFLTFDESFIKSAKAVGMTAVRRP
jgi:predicted nucleic-acid-binding protein